MPGTFLFEEEINEPHWNPFRTPELHMPTLTYKHIHKHTERWANFGTMVSQAVNPHGLGLISIHWDTASVLIVRGKMPPPDLAMPSRLATSSAYLKISYSRTSKTFSYYTFERTIWVFWLIGKLSLGMHNILKLK